MPVKVIPTGHPHLTPAADLAVLMATVVLLLASAALMLTGVLAAEIAIPLIAVGIAIVVIEQTVELR